MSNCGGAQLPPEVVMNPEAGRGGLLIVTIRLESGQKLPFLMDCGTSGTFFDKAFEPKLGKAIGTNMIQSWGVKKESKVYVMPKLYLGGVPLMTGSEVQTYDFGGLNFNGHPIMGMLGYDTLRHYCIQLDFAAGKLRFLDDEMLC